MVNLMVGIFIFAILYTLVLLAYMVGIIKLKNEKNTTRQEPNFEMMYLSDKN